MTYEQLIDQLERIDAIQRGHKPSGERSKKVTDPDLEPVYVATRQLLVWIVKGHPLSKDAQEKLATLRPILDLFPGSDQESRAVSLLAAVALRAKADEKISNARWQRLLRRGLSFDQRTTDRSDQEEAIHELAGLIVKAVRARSPNVTAEVATPRSPPYSPASLVLPTFDNPAEPSHLLATGRFTDWKASESAIVQRPDLVAELQLATEEANLPIVLWGESGNGKTRTAYNYAEALAAKTNKPFAVLRAGTHREDRDSVYPIDLARTLQHLGVEPLGLTQIEQESVIRDAISSPDCPICVLILDDAGPDDLTRIFPEHVAVPVLATSRETIAGTSGIAVPEYSPEEAMRFCQNLMPDADQQRLGTLCEFLGRRPLALEIALRSVVAEYFTLDDLLNALRTGPAETITALHTLTGDSGQGSLYALYEGISKRLVDDEMAFRILEVFLCFSKASIGIDDLRSVVFRTEPSAEQHVAYMAAGARLTRLALVVMRDDTVEMNELTREMLLAANAERIIPALDRIHADILESTEPDRLLSTPELWRAEYQLTKEALAELLGQGTAGLVALSSISWLVYAAGEPFAESASLGAGCSMARIFPEGLFHFGSEQKWQLGSPDQSTLMYHLAKTYIRLSHQLFIDTDVLDPESVHRVDGALLDFSPSSGDGYHHELLDVVHGSTAKLVGAPVWAICGKRWIPDLASGAARQLPFCPQCAELKDSTDYWVQIGTEAASLAAITESVTKDRSSMRARLLAIQCRSHLALNNTDDASVLQGQILQACMSEKEPTALTLDVFLSTLGQVPNSDYPLNEWVINWVQPLVTSLASPPDLLVRWAGKLVPASAAKVEHAAEALKVLAAVQRNDLEPGDEAFAAYVEATAVFTIDGPEAARPFYDKMLQSAERLPQENRFRQAMHELWTAVQDRE